MNLAIHRVFFWLTIATVLFGTTELALLYGQWIVGYSVVQLALSLWLGNRLDGHIYDLKVQRITRYWDQQWEQHRAKSKVNTPRVVATC